MTTATKTRQARRTPRTEWLHVRVDPLGKLAALRVARKMGHAGNVSEALRVLILRADQSDTRPTATR